MVQGVCKPVVPHLFSLHVHPQGVELGHVGLTEEKYIFVPAYDSPEHVNARHRALGTHSAVLVDPLQPSVPATDVHVRTDLSLSGVG